MDMMQEWKIITHAKELRYYASKKGVQENEYAGIAASLLTSALVFAASKGANKDELYNAFFKGVDPFIDRFDAAKVLGFLKHEIYLKLGIDAELTAICF